MAVDYQEMKRNFDRSPYASFLGMKLVELSRGYAKVALDVSPQHDNWDQRTHGGLMMSLIDQAFGCCLNTLDRIYVAVQLNVNFLYTPTEGETITAEGKVIHAGRSLGVAEMKVRDSKERVIATATGTTLGMGLRKPEENLQTPTQ